MNFGINKIMCCVCDEKWQYGKKCDDRTSK